MLIFILLFIFAPVKAQKLNSEEVDKNLIFNELQKENIKINNQQLIKLQKNYPNKIIMYMNQQLINSRSDEFFEVISKKEKFLKVTTGYNALNNEKIYLETEMSENDYDDLNQQQIKNLPLAATNILKVETTYKKLVLQLSRNTQTNEYFIDIWNYWKLNPSVRVFDVIAIRWNEKFKMTNVFGAQIGSINKISYLNNNANFKKALNGVGLSQNLLNSDSNIENYMFVNGTLNYLPNYLEVWGTYQHATDSTVTLAQSQSYSFSQYGLGNVLGYNSLISSKYDKMSGTYIYFAP